MDLMLNQILNLSEDEISISKIEFNMQAGKASEGGQPFIDRWLRYGDAEKASGTCEDCSYWGWYGNQHNYLPGQMAFSFIRMSAREWLFVSAAEIVEVPERSRAKVRVLKRFEPLYGRLVVNCSKGNTYGRYVFRLDRYLGQCAVKEILPCVYSGEAFEGYDKVHLPYSRLADIFGGRILPTYHDALKSVIGVYCLTDTHTGKHYIGSATGSDGVAQRWGNYLDTKHGGNKKLLDLHRRKGDGYFEAHFTFTLLEHFGLSYDPEKVIEREQYWKRCLDTVRNGYNDN